MEKTPGMLLDELITNQAGSAWFGPFGAESLRTGPVPKRRNLGIGWLLYAFVRAVQPDIILEVGSGGSSMPMLYSLNDNLETPPFKKGCLHTIDSFPWGNDVEVDGKIYKDVHLAFLKAIEKFGDLCKFYYAKSQDIGDIWDKPIDILVVDGDHSYAAVKSDWDKFSKWLKPGGYAFFHDVIACHDDIGRRVIEEACGPDSEFSLAIEPNSLSMSIIQRKFTVSPEVYFDCHWRRWWEGWEDDTKASITDARATGLLTPWKGSYLQTQKDWEPALHKFQKNLEGKKSPDDMGKIPREDANET